MEDLYDLYRNLEVLQNEYEIDLLRLHSQARDIKKNTEYMNDDISNNKVEISLNRQDVDSIVDSLEKEKNLPDLFFTHWVV